MHVRFFILLASAGLILNTLGMSCSDPLEGVAIDDVGDQKGIFAKEFKKMKPSTTPKTGTGTAKALKTESKPKTGDTTEKEDEDIFDMEF